MYCRRSFPAALLVAASLLLPTSLAEAAVLNLDLAGTVDARALGADAREPFAYVAQADTNRPDFLGNLVSGELAFLGGRADNAMEGALIDGADTFRVSASDEEMKMEEGEAGTGPLGGWRLVELTLTTTRAFGTARLILDLLDPDGAPMRLDATARLDRVVLDAVGVRQVDWRAPPPDVAIAATPVPLPAGAGLLATGLALLGLRRR